MSLLHGMIGPVYGLLRTTQDTSLEQALYLPFFTPISYLLVLLTSLLTVVSPLLPISMVQYNTASSTRLTD